MTIGLIRQVHIPSLCRRLSSLMAHPSSAELDTHERGLDEYRRLGGNCIHLHGEGGETHSRRVTGQWLGRQRLRPEFFLCTQICHEGWDLAAKRAIDRFTPAAVNEDVASDLELLGTDYLDLVYLDDNPRQPFEPMIEAMGREMGSGRVRAFGVRNWTAERIRAAQAYALSISTPGIAAVVTTELALAAAARPLWPEYVPFDAALERVVRTLGLAVFAHAADFNLGQCLFADEDAPAGWRPQWVQRWDDSANPSLVGRVRQFAAARGLTPREVNIGWLLNQPFPVVAVVSLPSLLDAGGSEYTRAAELRLDEDDLRTLSRTTVANELE
jgi:aryl-alcohol dehydrogenase-like predicted oxidoreductase